MRYSRFIVVGSMLICMLIGSVASAKEVNVYSARKEALIKPLLDKFTAQTAIKVNLVTGKADGLITRMKSEGQYSPVDLLITTDAGRLVRAKNMGLTRAMPTMVNLNKVDDKLFDADRHWTALTLRARPIMYSPERVDVADLSTMEDLASTKWRNRICIRSSSNIYNQSLVAAMIEQLGEQKTQAWAAGVAKNFARPPSGGDRDQIKAVVAGQCDIAVANTYYLAGMRESDDPDTRNIASKIKVFWPNQNNRGAHVNISGVAMAKHAKNLDEATALISYMLASSSQEWYSEVNGEYPVIEGVSWSETLEAMGRFKPENVALQVVGERNAEALRLMDRAGWK